MSFFDTTPSGRLLNRFSADLQKVDMMLRNQMASIFNASAQMIAGVSIILATTPYVAIVLPVVAIFYYQIQAIYRASSREVRRLQSIARSPVFQHFSEVLEGLTTVRAFRGQELLVTTAVEMMDRQCRCIRTGNSMNKWLSVRLDVLGAVVVLVVRTVSPLITSLTLCLLLHRTIHSLTHPTSYPLPPERLISPLSS